MKKKLSLILAVAMVAALFAVFAIPASAKTESEFPMGDIYKTILGTNDIGYTLYGEGDYWDWTIKADTPNMTGVPSGQHWLQFKAQFASKQTAPNYRISHVYVPENAVFADGEEMSINWLQVNKNNIICLCQNYNFNTGVVRPATMNFRGEIIEQNALPENERRGFIQFIDTVEFDGEKMIQKTYANGKLVLHTEVAGSLTWSGVKYNFLVMNANVTAADEDNGVYSDWFTIPSYVTDKGVRTTLCLYYHEAAVNESTVAGLYNAFANRYGKDVKWYPQDVEKNGLIVGKGGIRFYENGEYKTGWIDGRYFLKETGYMVTEDLVIGGVPCAYNATTLKMEFIDGTYGDFYFRNGEKVKGWLDDTHYYYLETGIKCTTSRTIGGVYYEYDTVKDTLSKQQGLIDEDGDVFYLIDGVKAGGWQNIDGEWYYFYKETGVMIIGATVKILGVEHTFDENGVCQDYAE